MPETAVQLRRVAHGRTGDKGDRSCISVIAYRPEFFSMLLEQVTEHAVAQVLSHRKPTHVKRYILEHLDALNFVIDGVLDGGVNDSLNLDTHGKSLAFCLLAMQVGVPAHLTPLLLTGSMGPGSRL